MSNGINKCIFKGNCTADPEVRFAQSGTAVCNFTLACNEYSKEKEIVEFVRCVCFGKTAEAVGKYTSKGTPLLVMGRMQTRSWDDKDGNKRYTTEIICNEVHFLGSKPESGSKKWEQPVPDVTEDSLPF